MGERRTTKSPTKISLQPQERGALNNSKSNVNSTNSSLISQRAGSNKMRSSNANISKDKPAASRRQTSTGSHAVKSTEEASERLSVSDWVHFIGMILLYTSQGLVQGVTLLVPLSFLHINKGFSKESIGLIGLPAYAFSFKFVWSPIVDLLWARRLCPALSETRSELNNHRAEASGAVHGKKKAYGYGGAGMAGFFNIRGLGHRRLQWTVLMQLGICFSLAYLHHLATTSTTTGDEEGSTASIWELIAHNMRSPFDVVIALGFLSFFNATQDIAVDAWAVEGLSPAKAKHAGALQFVGLTIGMTLYSIFTGFYTSNSEQYPISFYFIFVGIFCVSGVVVAVLTASLAPLWVEVKPQSDSSLSASCSSSSSSTVLNDVLGFLNTPSVRAVVLYLSTRGFMDSSGGLIGIEMMVLGWSSTADTATLSIVGTVTQLLTATTITPFILNRVGSFLANNSGSETKSLTEKGRSRTGRKHGEDTTSAASNSALSALYVMRVAIPLMASVHLFNYVFYTCVALSGVRLSPLPLPPQRLPTEQNGFNISERSSSSFVVDMLGGVDNTKWLYLWLVQVPQTVFLSIVRSSVFMCACTLFAREASKVANLTGTAVTILNSIANMGYALPASLTLLISERMMGLVFGTSGGSEAGYVPLPNTLTPAAFWAVLSGGFSVSVGLLLLILVTVPSIRKLEIDAKREA